jgi:hypothetical protein
MNWMPAYATGMDSRRFQTNFEAIGCSAGPNSDLLDVLRVLCVLGG